jgi:hypothetical protein
MDGLKYEKFNFGLETNKCPSVFFWYTLPLNLISKIDIFYKKNHKKSTKPVRVDAGILPAHLKSAIWSKPAETRSCIYGETSCRLNDADLFSRIANKKPFLRIQNKRKRLQ